MNYFYTRNKHGNITGTYGMDRIGQSRYLGYAQANPLEQISKLEGRRWVNKRIDNLGNTPYDAEVIVHFKRMNNRVVLIGVYAQTVELFLKTTNGLPFAVRDWIDHYVD